MTWEYSENYSITTRIIGTTRITTIRTQSTTMWTPMTLTHCTSTIAWRIATCTEPARIVSRSLMITLTLMAQVLSAFHLISISSMCAVVDSLFDSTFSALYFFTFLLSVFLSLFFLFYLELFPELLYTKHMANLRHSAANESEDTYDVFNSPTFPEVEHLFP